MLLSTPFSTNHALFGKLPYETTDFRAIVQMVTVPTAFWVNVESPVKSVPELIALAKAKPGQVNYASVGAGGVTHLAMEFFNSLAGVKTVHIPFKGPSEATTELLTGRSHIIIQSAVSTLPRSRVTVSW